MLSVPDACLKLGFSNTGFCDVRAKYDYEVAIEDMREDVDKKRSLAHCSRQRQTVWASRRIHNTH